MTSSAEEKTVTASVTPITIAIQLTETSISYGSLQAGNPEVGSTPEEFGVINRGSVPLDFEIQGGNSSNGWTLASTPDENKFRHAFSTNNTSFTALTTSYQQLFNDVGIDAEINVFMRFTMPTSYTTTGLQTFPIKVRASMSTP